MRTLRREPASSLNARSDLSISRCFSVMSIGTRAASSTVPFKAPSISTACWAITVWLSREGRMGNGPIESSGASPVTGMMAAEARSWSLAKRCRKPGVLHALFQQQAGFGLRRQQGSLQLGFVAQFVFEGFGDLDKGLMRSFGRLAEPLIQVAVQHFVAEQHQEQGRRDAEGQGAQDQLGLDARAFAAAAPVDVQLHDGAHQHEAQRDHQHEDQAGDGPEDEGLLRVGRAVFAEIEGTLPDDKRHRDRQQDDAAAVEDSLSHLFEL